MTDPLTPPKSALDPWSMLEEFASVIGHERPHRPGAGLGLYISRGLARAHDGDLYVLPGENEGSEFILTLPA